jgi:Spy/CpxP family protein refolding chaperone
MNETETKSAGRRRFFKRAAIATAIGSIAAAVGFKALAEPGEHLRWHRGLMHANFTPEQAEQRVGRMLKHFYVEIDATEAQKQKLDPIVKQAAKDLMPLRLKMHEARKQGAALLTAETVDRAAIETFRAQQLQLAESASKRFSQALADVADVLTPAQRKDLAQRLQKMGPGMRGGMHHG